MKERTKLAWKWEERCHTVEGGRGNLAELCHKVGTSRQTGREWVRATARSAASMLVDRSRRPLISTMKVSEEVEPLWSRRASSGRPG
jgi:hypothetical protein